MTLPGPLHRKTWMRLKPGRNIYGRNCWTLGETFTRRTGELLTLNLGLFQKCLNRLLCIGQKFFDGSKFLPPNIPFHLFALRQDIMMKLFGLQRCYSFPLLLQPYRNTWTKVEKTAWGN